MIISLNATRTQKKLPQGTRDINILSYPMARAGLKLFSSDFLVTWQHPQRMQRLLWQSGPASPGEPAQGPFTTYHPPHKRQGL